MGPMCYRTFVIRQHIHFMCYRFLNTAQVANCVRYMFHVLQVFYTTHIVGFICLMTFAFIHYQSMWAYTLPGES